MQTFRLAPIAILSLGLEAPLGEGSDIMATHSVAMQLRNLRSMLGIGVDKNTTVVFPASLMSMSAELGTFLATRHGVGRQPGAGRGRQHPFTRP